MLKVIPFPVDVLSEQHKRSSILKTCWWENWASEGVGAIGGALSVVDGNSGESEVIILDHWESPLLKRSETGFDDYHPFVKKSSFPIACNQRVNERKVAMPRGRKQQTK